MHEGGRAAAVRVPVDPVPGGETGEHDLGIDRFGVAVGRRGPRHYRQQPALPDFPYLSGVVEDARPVDSGESEDNVAGVREAEEVVFLDGVLLLPHFFGQLGDLRPQRRNVHGTEPSYQGRFLDRLKPGAVGLASHALLAGLRHRKDVCRRDG